MTRFYIDYEWLSPYTFTVHAALLEKGVLFDLREVRFKGGECLDEEYRGKTPTDLIPGLDDGDGTLWESLAILEYLEEKYPAPKYASLWPKAPGERALARALLSWYRCGFKALRDERSTETIFYDSERAKTKPLSAAAREEVREWMVALEPRLRAGGGFLFGAQWSIADSETALMAQRLLATPGFELDSRLRALAERVWQRPSSRAFVEHARPPFQSYY